MDSPRQVTGILVGCFAKYLKRSGVQIVNGSIASSSSRKRQETWNSPVCIWVSTSQVGVCIEARREFVIRSPDSPTYRARSVAFQIRSVTRCFIGWCIEASGRLTLAASESHSSTVPKHDHRHGYIAYKNLDGDARMHPGIRHVFRCGSGEGSYQPYLQQGWI
jgi:hypothetical protein